MNENFRRNTPRDLPPEAVVEAPKPHPLDVATPPGPALGLDLDQEVESAPEVQAPQPEAKQQPADEQVTLRFTGNSRISSTLLGTFEPDSTHTVSRGRADQLLEILNPDRTRAFEEV